MAVRRGDFNIAAVMLPRSVTYTVLYKYHDLLNGNAFVGFYFEFVMYRVCGILKAAKWQPPPNVDFISKCQHNWCDVRKKKDKCTFRWIIMSISHSECLAIVMQTQWNNKRNYFEIHFHLSLSRDFFFYSFTFGGHARIFVYSMNGLGSQAKTRRRHAAS